MNRILYEQRCKCNEEFSIRKSITTSEGKPLRYPKKIEWRRSKMFDGVVYDPIELRCKTFQIKYEKRLSSTTKLILTSFQNKYIYYAIDDILYSLKLNPRECENILAILYSPILSLQNNFSTNFFNIWIREIYIDEISKVNKFLTTESQTSEQFSYITLKLFYQTSVPVKKQEPIW